MGATLLKQRGAQKKPTETTKRPRVETTTKDVPIVPPTEEVPFDPAAAILDVDDEDDANVDVAGPSRSTTPLSLSSCHDGDVYDDSSSSWTAFRQAYFRGCCF